MTQHGCHSDVQGEGEQEHGRTLVPLVARRQPSSPRSMYDNDLLESTLEELLQGRQIAQDAPSPSTGAQTRTQQTTTRQPGRVEAAAQAAGAASALTGTAQDIAGLVPADVAQPAGRHQPASHQATGTQATQAASMLQHRGNRQAAAAAAAVAAAASFAHAGSQVARQAEPDTRSPSRISSGSEVRLPARGEQHSPEHELLMRFPI